MFSSHGHGASVQLCSHSRCATRRAARACLMFLNGTTLNYFCAETASGQHSLLPVRQNAAVGGIDTCKDSKMQLLLREQTLSEMPSVCVCVCVRGFKIFSCLVCSGVSSSLHQKSGFENEPCDTRSKEAHGESACETRLGLELL